ncbi:hypothetical protein U2F10_03100 [Leptothoe sp. EHU-05/26/07-4]
MLQDKQHAKLLLIAASSILTTFGLFNTSVEAATYKLDFDSITIDDVVQEGSIYSASEGRDIDDEWANWGINISGINYRGNGQYDNSDPNATLRLYDTRTRDGKDHDLETGADYGTKDQGNALIIQKHSERDSSSPNDDANGGEVLIDFTDESGVGKQINFQQFTLLDVELEEDGNKGINVFGYNKQGSKILDIDVDALVSGFYNKYDGEYNADNLSKTNKTPDGVVYNPGDQEPSFSLNGVTLYQEGQQLGNNTVFRFEIDENNETAQSLSQIKFQYADVSGAISGVKWSDTDSPESPESVPESSMLLGLVMLGAFGVYRQRLRQVSVVEVK